MMTMTSADGVEREIERVEIEFRSDPFHDHRVESS